MHHKFNDINLVIKFIMTFFFIILFLASFQVVSATSGLEPVNSVTTNTLGVRV